MTPDFYFFSSHRFLSRLQILFTDFILPPLVEAQPLRLFVGGLLLIFTLFNVKPDILSASAEVDWLVGFTFRILVCVSVSHILWKGSGSAPHSPRSL